MHDDRLIFSTDEALRIPADVLVVEGSGDLPAARGLAVLVDELYPALQARRAQALAAHGRPYPPGAALPFGLDDAPDGRRGIVWAITSTVAHGDGPGQPPQRVRATPLDVAAATHRALLEADRLGAASVVLPALGTRLGYHALPPTPKKLPRYVMGAAQLIGIQQALEQGARLRQIILSLSQRDYAIFQELLGRSTDEPADDGEHDA